jgi:hypothetical protein
LKSVITTENSKFFKAETMKTRKAMKTKTNFRKTAMRSGAVVVSFVLVSFTVSAQGFWKKLLTNSSFSEIAIAMIETPAVERVAEVPVKGTASWTDYDKAFDPVLELEGWMTSENYFHNSGTGTGEGDVKETAADTGFILSAQESDEALELEAWMTTPAFWGM